VPTDPPRKAPPPRPAARALLVAAAAWLGCDDTKDPVHPSYDRCAADEPCGLSTQCRRAGLTTRDAGASFCTTECSFERECPGVAARCVSVAVDDAGPRGQCYRACESDRECRVGSTCHALRVEGSRVGVCVPDTGTRACRTALDCAPFEDVCDVTDAGASPFDASATGACRIAIPASP
jgi:hypothetical protein